MTATCRHCHRITDLIVGEGRVVCRGCLRTRAGWVAHPWGLSPIDIGLLDRHHGDVVQLVTRLDPLTREWRWDPTWPTGGPA